ncbi:MAG: hypothetical protein KatS3mg077_1010 [Candidatus Binatia bacterium]|nr:MAG: hypothetical protein KatS3mg077_1010 [Candidatus Binatia bacterium]
MRARYSVKSSILSQAELFSRRRQSGRGLDIGDHSRPNRLAVLTPKSMLRVLLVGCGGFLGSACRYLVGGWVQGTFAASFPWGTLAVNSLGSLLLGFFLALSLERGWLGMEWRLFLTIGFCGGFTTMSTFGYETFSLIREGSYVLAFANVGANLLTAVLGAWVGDLAGRVS